MAITPSSFIIPLNGTIELTSLLNNANWSVTPGAGSLANGSTTYKKILTAALAGNITVQAALTALTAKDYISYSSQQTYDATNKTLTITGNDNHKSAVPDLEITTVGQSFYFPLFAGSASYKIIYLRNGSTIRIVMDWGPNSNSNLRIYNGTQGTLYKTEAMNGRTNLMVKLVSSGSDKVAEIYLLESNGSPTLIYTTAETFNTSLKSSLEYGGELPVGTIIQPYQTATSSSESVTGYVYQASFTISNNNPQNGGSVTITNTSVKATGSYTHLWEFNNLTHSTEENPPALNNLSPGLNTLRLTLTNGSTNHIYSKTFFVGTLAGADSVGVGLNSGYSTNVSGAKWTTDFGTINQSGLFTAPNQAGTANLKAENNFWAQSSNKWTINGNNSITLNDNTSTNVINADAVTLTRSGDNVTFVISSKQLFVGLRDDTNFLRLEYPYNTIRESYANPEYTSVTFNLNQTVKMQKNANGKIEIYADNVLKFTSQQSFGNCYLHVFNNDTSTPNGYTFAAPVYAGDGITGYKVATKSLTIYAPAVANFNLPTTINLNQLLTLTNTSTGATSYEWDIGNNGTIDYTTASPTVTFTSIGQVDIRLRAINAYGYDEEVKTIFVVPPQLATSYAPNSNLTAPVKIQFTDISGITVNNPRWDFGDYAQSEELSPSHTYLAPGIYKVKRWGIVGGALDDDAFSITVSGNATTPPAGALVFDEVELPRYYSEGAKGGPEFSTSILGNPQGRQQRNINRYDAIHKFEIQFEGETYKGETFRELLDFFYSRYGAGIGFRFFPNYDNRWDNERIATTNPSQSVYPLIRTYKKAGRDYVRRIVKPVPDVEVTINNFDADYYSDYTVDYLSGRIAFATPGNLPSGGALRVTGEYCIPVTFSTDRMEGTGYSSYVDLTGLQVVEILPSALGIND